MTVVPELLCSDLTRSRVFYVDLLGFSVWYERPEEGFVYLRREDAHLMLEALTAPGRKWVTAELAHPFGRGMNLQIEVEDVGTLYERCRTRAPERVYLDLEDKSYRRDHETIRQRQFVIQDPDGYLIRLCSPLGGRATP